MNIFKSLFKMPKLVEAAISTGDALVFTDEERKKWLLESAKVLGPQTLARRVIAIIVTCLWTVMTIVVMVSILMSVEKIVELAELYIKVTLVFGGVMSFYFGASLARGIKNGN